MFEWVWNNAAKLRDLAAIFGVLGTVGGVGVSVWRARIERRLQREVNAKRTYAGVLRMSFENPEYAEPSKPLHDDPEKGVRYLWFVSNVLNALDEILLSTDEPIWRTTSALLVEHHLDWLSTDWFAKEELPTYSSELQQIISTAVSKHREKLSAAS